MKNLITKAATANGVSKEEMKIVIVDDELIACRNLQQILLQHFTSELHILGMANNTAEAELLIEKYNPDAVFMDIEMPKENALRFLERIHPFSFEVVFVTGHDNYAVKAFKLNAIDYVLKPINIYELKDAVEKIKNKLLYKNTVHRSKLHYNKLAQDLNSNGNIRQIILNKKDTIEVVDMHDILYLEAQGSYTNICFLKNGKPEHFLMGYTIAEYEALLPDMFFRIHRSYLVNCMHIKKITKDENSFVVMQDKFNLPIGRRRYPDLIYFLRRNAFIC